jgi:hypothetical protein
VTDSESHDQPENDWGEDGEPELIVCPQCAHPNLIFRTHCRKCGGRLIGTANLIPGAELIEWSPTDGPPTSRHATAPLRVLVMLAGAIGFVLTGYAIQTESSVGLIMALAPVIAAVLIYRQIRNIEAQRMDDDDAPPEDSPACPECGEPVYDYDDICAACGSLTATRNEDDNIEA